MNEEIRFAIGLCADCVHLFCKVITTYEDEELCYFKCLVSDEHIESCVKQCSHCYKNDASLFLTEEFRKQ